MEIIDQNDFKQLVASEKELFIISFYTDSCPNCKTLESIFEDIEKSTPIRAYKIDAEKEYELVREFELLGVPTTFFYRHGVLVDKKLGVKSKNTLLKSIAKFNNFTPKEAKEYSKKSFVSKMFSGWAGK